MTCFFSFQIIKIIHKRSAEKLLNGCLANGGLYIKIGQGLSAINHILPTEYIETLKKLEDKCLTRTRDEVRKLFIQDFGSPPEKIFHSFDYEPIAAASLAQVFRAKTKKGQDVAVKVQYIDLQRRFQGDIGTILFLQSLVALVHKNYDFGWVLRDLQNSLKMELDFINEGQNSEHAAMDLAKFKFVYIPKVLWEYTNKRVLTTEFINGYKISDMESLKKEKINLADLDSKLFRTFGEQIFRTGFVHADPHPGNVFVRKNKSGKVELVLLDHGLYENLDADVRENLCRFWEAIVLKDYRAMQKYSKALNVPDYEIFAEILLQRPLEMKGTFSTKLSDEDIKYMTDMARKRFDLIMKTLKDMPRNIIFVIRNLNTVRSIAREHGDIVDRPRIMARCALHSLRSTHKGLFGFFSYIRRKLNFEYQLWKMSFQFWLVSTYLSLLTKLGRSPDTSHLLDVEVNV